MTNEQRAHDLALLVTKCAISKPQYMVDGSVSVDENGVYTLDIYKIYKLNYQKILESINRDFEQSH